MPYTTLLRSSSMHDPKFNRLLRDDVDRIFERYRALPASPERDLKMFCLQIKAEIAAHLPVCHFQCHTRRSIS